MRPYPRPRVRSIRVPSRAVARGLLLLPLLFPAAAHADAGPGVEIEDQIDVLRVDRKLVAIRSRTGQILEERLEQSETPVALGSQGVVGVVSTNRRLLGVTSRSGSWQVVRLRLRETAPRRFHLGDRMVLVPLGHRVLAFTRGAGIWSELALHPGETPAHLSVDTNVGFFVTDLRAVAISESGGGFVEVSLTPREAVDWVSMQENLVTVQTTYRLLSFRTGADRWVELRRTDFRSAPRR